MIKHLVGALIGLCLLPVALVYRLEDVGARVRRQMANARARKNTRKRERKRLKG